MALKKLRMKMINKKSNKIRLSETVAKVDKGGDLHQKVNQLENLLRRSNIEIQGLLEEDNENMES